MLRNSDTDYVRAGVTALTKNTIIRDDRGVSPIIEATIYLPFCIIAIMALLYATIFLCVQANLQTSLQTAIIYFKNQESDTYVYTDSEMTISDVSVADMYVIDGIKNPYRMVKMKFQPSDLKAFVSKLGGYMFFSDMEKVKVEAKRSNHLFCKKITAAAEVRYKPAISFAPALGKEASESRVLRSSATMVITDGDETIRFVDFIDDITGLGDDLQEMLSPIVQIYEKFRDVFMN